MRSMAQAVLSCFPNRVCSTSIPILRCGLSPLAVQGKQRECRYQPYKKEGVGNYAFPAYHENHHRYKTAQGEQGKASDNKVKSKERGKPGKTRKVKKIKKTHSFA
jgi:hypothetical protein